MSRLRSLAVSEGFFPVALAMAISAILPQIVEEAGACRPACWLAAEAVTNSGNVEGSWNDIAVPPALAAAGSEGVAEGAALSRSAACTSTAVPACSFMVPVLFVALATACSANLPQGVDEKGA